MINIFRFNKELLLKNTLLFIVVAGMFLFTLFRYYTVSSKIVSVQDGYTIIELTKLFNQKDYNVIVK